MTRFSRLGVTGAALLVSATALLPLGGGSASHAAGATSSSPASRAAVPARSGHHRKARGGLRFSHEVVVDEQRNGFEPDVLVDSHDHLYTSVPNGSSQGTSFVWSSRDHGKSFQLVPGSVLQGKPATCSGGGDTELQLDTHDNLFLSDLQNLTNLSNSVTRDGGATWQTTCVGATNTPVDRMWYAVQGALGQPNFAIYEEYDAVASGADPGNPAGNQLVEEVSSDGVNFVPVLNPGFTNGCLGGGAYNCVSNDEGISGNQLVTPSGEVLIAHSSADGKGVVVSYSTPRLVRAGGRIVSASATWHDVTVNKAICPDQAGQAPGVCGASQFATIARDSAGTLYVSFSSQRLDASGKQTGPYNVYVVHSRDQGHTWSKPALVSRGGSNSFSWVTAGSRGRVAMAWYHANMARGRNGYAFDDLTNAEFSVQVGESVNALSAHPHFAVSTVSEHPIKYGPICTQGLNCTISGGDRSLGDFLEVSKDRRGALLLSYVDDTSNTYSTGATGFAENGPPVVVRQIHGPALIKGSTNRRGTVTGSGRGPGAAVGHIADAAHDDAYSANGRRTYAGRALDLRRAVVRQSKNHRRLLVTMKASSLKSLTVPSGAGGTTGEWITRFTTYNPHTLGNGHIYYVGMESVRGAKPTFYDGDTASPGSTGVQLSMTFSSAHHTTGRYDAKKGTITINAPLSDFPGLTRAHHTMYSTTAFTGTTTASLAVPNPTGLQGQINQVDATAPFNKSVRVPKPAAPGAPHRDGAGWIAPAAGGLGAAGLAAAGAAYALGRRRRHAREGAALV